MDKSDRWERKKRRKEKKGAIVEAIVKGWVDLRKVCIIFDDGCEVLAVR